MFEVVAYDSEGEEICKVKTQWLPDAIEVLRNLFATPGAAAVLIDKTAAA